MIEIRPARLPDDIEAIEAIDRSFRSDTALAPIRGDHGIEFLPYGVAVEKVLPLDDLREVERAWDTAWVAVRDGTPCGFAAVGFQEWNRRLALWHLYVDASVRGQGVARRLIDVVAAHARGLGARHLWLEASSVNTPAIEAYKALEFQVTGFDLTLYDGTEAEGEFALFLSRELED